ncbi:MAG TPA: hypothetical protein DGT23_22430 [Micromonosporaceae bacterium]|nr:hypothetical protein [Micromonosporaceae bacterium]
MSGDFLWTRKQTDAAATGSDATAGFDTSKVGRGALDINVKTITGGTTPDITFHVDRLGGDGIWYPVASTAALTATGPVSLSICDAVADGADAQHAVFTTQARVRWVFAGGVPATSIAFSGSFYGRE